MMTDDLELLITRFIDGELSTEEQAHLDVEIARNPEAQRVLEQHLKLDVALRSEPALEAINWDGLASDISASIADAEVEQQKRYAMPWVRVGAGLLALAASLLIVIGIWMRSNPSGNTNTVANGPGNKAAPVVYVFLTSDKPSGPAVQEIRIAPPTGMLGQDLAIREAIVPRPTRVAIDSGLLPAQDNDASLFR